MSLSQGHAATQWSQFCVACTFTFVQQEVKEPFPLRCSMMHVCLCGTHTSIMVFVRICNRTILHSGKVQGGCCRARLPNVGRLSGYIIQKYVRGSQNKQHVDSGSARLSFGQVWYAQLAGRRYSTRVPCPSHCWQHLAT